MPTLVLVRSKSTIDCWDVYECKTEVIIFGDIAGYRVLQHKLLAARASELNVHLDLLAKSTISMRAVILSPQNKMQRRPRLKFMERLVHISGAPHMELVIAGNAEGYRYLAASIAKLVATGKGDPSNHAHMDDMTDPVVIPRSIALNIRAPLRKWDSGKLGEFAGLVEKPGEDFLPKDVEYRIHTATDYQEITVRNSEVVRI